jgi:hypothetical protein
VIISCLNGNASMINSLPKNNVKPLLIKTLFDFLNTLTKNTLQSLSNQIVQRFYDNKYRAHAMLLHKLYEIYSKSISQLKLKHFNIWKTFINTDDNDNNNKNTSLEFNNKIKDGEDYFNTHYNQSKYTLYKTSTYPIMLKKKYNTNSNINNSFGGNTANTNININNIHTPIIFNSNRLTNQQQLSTISKRTNSASQIETFLQRQEDFKHSKQRKLEKRLQLSETALDGIYTFSPNISSHFQHSYSDSLKATHIRLYEDSNVRKRKIQQKVSECGSTITSPKQKTKTIDKSQIEKLYNDYKLRKTRRKMLMDKVNCEEGITFKPVVHLSPSYLKRINGTFFERNRKSIENKQNFITTYNYLREMELMEMRQNNLTKYLKDGNMKY